MTNHPKTLEEALEMFDELEITISNARSQFDHEQREKLKLVLPIAFNLFKPDLRLFITTIWHAGRESVVQDCEGMIEIEKSAKPASEGEEMYEFGYCTALANIITKLSELKK